MGDKFKRVFAAALVAVIAAFTLTTAAPAAGQSSAPPAPSAQNRTLTGFHAPKGNPALRPAAGNARAMLTGPYYHYALARQILTSPQTSTGMAANLTIENPDVESGGHSLAEVAVSSTSLTNYVEIGWRKAAGDITRLFAFHWINGVPQGYNAFFVENAAVCNVAGNICPGDALPTAGTQKRFEILYSGGNWWLSYDLKWIGYFPGTRWSTYSPPQTFTAGMVLSGFMETVHPTNPNTCSDMGDGQTPVSTTAARVGSMAITGLSPAGTVTDFGPTDVLPTTTPATVYDSARLSATTMRAGGPGWNAAGTAAGTAGAC